MDTVDITPTPEACRQIARLFRAQKADAEALASCAARPGLPGRHRRCSPGPLEPCPPRRRLAALHDAERARVRHMDEGLEAIAPYGNATDREGSDDAA